jgi:hypothetical protein
VLIDSTGLQVYGAGQWLEAKHGAKSRRTWHKLHLAVDAASGLIVAQTLTDQDVDDPSQVGSRLDQIDDPIVQVTADGAYDGAPTYQTIVQHGDGIEVVIPPRATAVPSGEGDTPTARSPSGDDRGTRSAGLAGRDRPRSTDLSRNDNGPLQDADRTAAAGSRLCGPTDRSCHRRGRAKPDVGGRTPGFCPSPADHRITTRGWGHLALRLEVHQRPKIAEFHRILLRQVNDRRLACAVGDAQRAGAQTRDRGDVYDCAVSLRLHDRAESLGAEEGAIEVGAFAITAPVAAVWTVCWWRDAYRRFAVFSMIFTNVPGGSSRTTPCPGDFE